jgi:hypothetical protein
MNTVIHSPANVVDRESPSRLAVAVHYVIANTPPQRLGSTKLNKVLWAADVSHFRRTGKSVTGSTAYKKLQFGPVPIGVVDALRVLEKEGKISHREINTASGKRREFWSKVRPELSIFSADELDSLVQAILAIYKLSAAAASELTHDDLWQETALGKHILVAAAAVTIKKPSAKAFKWAEAVVKRISSADEHCEAA